MCCTTSQLYAYDTHYRNCSSRNTPTLWAVPTTLIGTALASVGLAWFRAPTHFTPTPDNITLTTIIPTQHTKKNKLLNLSAVKQQLRKNKHTAACIDIGAHSVEIYPGIHSTAIQQTIPPHIHPLQTIQPQTSSNTPILSKKKACLCNPIFLVSPGFMGKRPQKYSQEAEPETGLDQAAHFIEHSIIHGPCITFNYNDDRRVFNFGQTTDIACLKTAYNTVKNSDIVLVGTCRGATTALNLLSQLEEKDFEHIKAVILESPALCLEHLAAQVAHTYVGWLPKSPTIIHSFFKFWFPSYNPAYPLFLPKLSALPKNLPILIGHLENDKVIAYSDIVELVQQLQNSGHTHIYLSIIQDTSTTHARLSRIPRFQQVCNAFLKEHGIMHDQKLANQGKNLLKTAQKCAQLLNQPIKSAIQPTGILG